MYCGSCNAYIPDGIGMMQCPACGISVEEARKAREAVEQKARQEALQRAVEIKKTEKQYGYLEALFYSFFSKYFYRDVALRWQGSGILYLTFFLGLCLILPTLGFWREARKAYQEQMVPVLQQLPPVAVSGSQIRFEGESPLKIQHPKTGDVIGVFDRSASPTDYLSLPGIFFVTPHHISYKEQNQLRTFRITPLLELVLTPDRILYWANQISRWFTYWMVPLLWMASLLFALFCAWLYSLAGIVISKIVKARISYVSIFRLAVVAMTPMILLDGLVSFWKPFQGLPNFIEIPMPLFFMSLGLWHNRGVEGKKAS